MRTRVNASQTPCKQRQRMSMAEDAGDFRRKLEALVQRKQDDWNQLEPRVLSEIVEEGSNNEFGDQPNHNTPAIKFEYLVRTNFERALNEHLHPQKRRLAYSVLIKLLDDADSALLNLKQRTKHQASRTKQYLVSLNMKNITRMDKPSVKSGDGAMPSKGQVERARSSRVANDVTLTTGKKYFGPDGQNQGEVPRSYTSISQKGPVCGVQSNPLPGRQKRIESTAHRQGAGLNQRASSGSNVRQNGSPAVSRRPKGKTVGTAGSSDRQKASGVSTQTSKRERKVKSNEMQSNGNDLSYVSDPRHTGPQEIWFQSDPNKFGGTQKPRGLVNVSYVRSNPGEELIKKVMHRLQVWDPYWKLIQMVKVAVTVEPVKLSEQEYKPATGATKSDKPPPPQVSQVLSLRLKLSPSAIKTLGGPAKAKQKKDSYRDGDTRLMLRMLPLQDIVEKSASKKNMARADTHLWPKGTFIQVDGKPQSIKQRKMNNLGEWAGVSSPLDLGARLTNPETEMRLDLLHVEQRSFMAVISVCQYVSPVLLVKRKLQSNFPKFSQADFLKRARGEATEVVAMNSNGKKEGSERLHVPLRCPMSMKVMKHPVKGRICTHLRCFDFQTFIELNENITGTRWQCPVCSKFLSASLLIECEFTRGRLEQYADRLRSGDQDVVEVYPDGNWALQEKENGSRKQPSIAMNLEIADLITSAPPSSAKPIQNPKSGAAGAVAANGARNVDRKRPAQPTNDASSKKRKTTSEPQSKKPLKPTTSKASRSISVVSAQNERTSKSTKENAKSRGVIGGSLKSKHARHDIGQKDASKSRPSNHSQQRSTLKSPNNPSAGMCQLNGTIQNKETREAPRLESIARQRSTPNVPDLRRTSKPEKRGQPLQNRNAEPPLRGHLNDKSSNHSGVETSPAAMVTSSLTPEEEERQRMEQERRFIDSLM